MARVLVLVGTKSGAFLLRGDAKRERWDIRGPLADEDWEFGFLCFDPNDGGIYAAGRSPEHGAAIWKSLDLGDTWTFSSAGLTHGPDRTAVNQVWSIVPVDGALYAGVDPAGLFRSDDRGTTWRQVGTPLLNLPSAVEWRGGKGGLCLHSIVPHPADPRRIWVAIAGGGVLFTPDGGQSWEPRNLMIGPDQASLQPGYRVQQVALAAGGGDLLYQQNHLGVYRSADGGITWVNVTAELPSPFGFPLALHPRDSETLYVIPHLHSPTGRYIPGGRMAVWRSRTGGNHWETLTRGLPTEPAVVEVLRHGMATDAGDPAGVYVGTTSGQVYGSADEGESWATIAEGLPGINSVAARTT